MSGVGQHPWGERARGPVVTARAATAPRARRARTSGHGTSAAAGAHSSTGLLSGVRQLPTSTLLGIDVGLLCVFGLVMVGSASSVISISLYGTPWAILMREGLWMALGLVAFVVTIRVDYSVWRKVSGLLLVGTGLLLLAVLVPGVGVHVQGSSRWLGFGEFRVQPSEVMKLSLVVFSADFIARRLDEGSSDRRIMGPILLVCAVACVLILAQPDMGTAMVLGCVTLTLLFVAGVRLGPVLKVLALLVCVAGVVAVASPYRRTRLLSFLDPSAHGSSSGYQVLQSLIGLGSGHLFGAGLGGGQQQWGFLPNAHTDFIFSVIGEELGFVGASAAIFLLGFFMWFGVRAARRAPDRFGGLLAIGLVAWMASETLINIGAVVGVLPVTGIPLPFISFGGSSLVITLAAAGILVNVARHERTAAVHVAPVRSASTSRPRRLHGAPAAASTRARGW
ncbi:MAG TPA: putative lipid II flippase FtsW [Acidimicrobiales bacterium]|nr:putative lipid II flippase FtsW [Acidimicrobiales bacterium]